MGNSCVPALALCSLLSSAILCIGQSLTGPVTVRGHLTSGPGVAPGRYTVELADFTGSSAHEYLADVNLSGHFELPSVEQGAYTYCVRNDRGLVVQTGLVQVTTDRQELDIFVSSRRNEVVQAHGAISVMRLAHRPVKTAKKEFLKGQSASGRGDRGAALRGYARAVEIDPEWYEARVNYAAQLYHAGRTADALIQAQAAIGIDPASVEAYVTASAALSTLGNFPEAADAAARAVKLAPQSAKGRYLLGFALLSLSRVNEAVEQLRRAGPFAPARELLAQIAETRSYPVGDNGR